MFLWHILVSLTPFCISGAQTKDKMEETAANASEVSEVNISGS